MGSLHNKHQKRLDKRFGGMCDRPSVNETITTYSYIYDWLTNWIFKISMNDNKINIITQREIQYQ